VPSRLRAPGKAERHASPIRSIAAARSIHGVSPLKSGCGQAPRVCQPRHRQFPRLVTVRWRQFRDPEMSTPALRGKGCSRERSKSRLELHFVASWRETHRANTPRRSGRSGRVSSSRAGASRSCASGSGLYPANGQEAPSAHRGPLIRQVLGASSRAGARLD